jgi:hypothetical protein
VDFQVPKRRKQELLLDEDDLISDHLSVVDLLARQLMEVQPVPVNYEANRDTYKMSPVKPTHMPASVENSNNTVRPGTVAQLPALGSTIPIDRTNLLASAVSTAYEEFLVPLQAPISQVPKQDEGIQTETTTTTITTSTTSTENKAVEESFVSPLYSPRYGDKEEEQIREIPEVVQPSQQQEPRMSPSSLKTRLLTEINMLEVIGQSEQQLSALDFTNAIGKAQQETAILAQILQQRQVTDERERRLQREIEEIKAKLLEERKRDTHVQTEKQSLNDSRDSNRMSAASSPGSSVRSSISRASSIIDEEVKSTASAKSKQSKASEVNESITSVQSSPAKASGVDEDIEGMRQHEIVLEILIVRDCIGVSTISYYSVVIESPIQSLYKC